MMIKPAISHILDITRNLSLLLCLCLTLLSASSTANAEPAISKQHKIMAAFLVRFASYTQWPNTPENKIKLCIFGDDPFKQFIDTMAKKRSTSDRDQKIQILRLNESDEIRSCHILYSSEYSAAYLWSALPNKHSILLVSKFREFLAQGGMINFVVQNKRIKLEVNLPAVTHAKLKISSQLLKHAKIVANPTAEVDI